MYLAQGRRLDSRWAIYRVVTSKRGLACRMYINGPCVDVRGPPKLPDNRRGGECSHERFQALEAYSFSQTTKCLIAAPKRARPRKTINIY